MNKRSLGQQNIGMEFSESDVLNFLLQNANMDMEDVARDMKKSKEAQIISQHPYTISKHKDNRWRTYVKKRDGTRKLLVASTEQHLIHALVEYYAELNKKDVADIITVESLYPTWLKLKQLHGANSTYLKRINADWRNYYVDTPIIKIPLSELHKLDMDVWAHQLIQKVGGRKKQYYNISMIMRQVLDYAVDAEMISKNPLRLVQINARMVFVPEKKKPSETQVFSPEEVKHLYHIAWQDFYYNNRLIHKLAPLAVMFQFQTGVRIGELCALRYEDIVDQEIYVQRMYQFEEKNIVEYVKGHHDGRYIILTPFAFKLIEKAKEYQKDNNLNCTGYIFSINDDPLSYYAVRKRYEVYCEKLDTYMKSSHKSRKTYISTLIDAGVNIDAIREMVGHEDERTTYNSYCYDRKTKPERAKLIAKALS